MSLQLVAISNITDQLKQDYELMKKYMADPTLSNTLMPYIKIVDKTTGKVLYENTRYLHNIDEDSSDILLDLLSLDLTVGKNGMPSLVGGNVKFKLYNANKFITEDNAIRRPELFSLLSKKQIIFGWYDPAFKKFNEEVIEVKFSHKSDTQNTAIIDMEIGSPLTFFNKVESAYIGGIKDVSDLPTSIAPTYNQKYSGKININSQTIESIIDNEILSNNINYLVMFDNFLSLNSEVEKSSVDGLPFWIQHVIYPYKNTLINRFSKYYLSDERNPDATNNISDSSENLRDSKLYRYDEFLRSPLQWYGNKVNFTDTNYTKDILLIHPRLIEYSFNNPNAENEIENNILSLLDSYIIDDKFLYGAELEYITDLYRDRNDDLYGHIYKIYYLDFLYNSQNSPLLNNRYDGLNKDRTRLLNLMNSHIKFIANLNQFIQNEMSVLKTKGEIKFKFRKFFQEQLDLFGNADETIIKIMRPILISQDSIEELREFSQSESSLSINKPVADSYEELSTIGILPIIMLLELNYTEIFKNNSPFYDNNNWISLINSALGYTTNLTTIYKCFRYIATYLNKNWIEPCNWNEIYNIIMSDNEDDKLEIQKLKEIDALNDADDLVTTSSDIFGLYYNKSYITLGQIADELSGKLNRLLKDDFKIKIIVYDKYPSLVQNREYVIPNGNSSMQFIMSDPGNSEYKLKNLLLPKKVYVNMKNRADSLLGIIRDIFDFFRKHFNINLEFSIYNDNGKVNIEIFCVDVITDEIDRWDGGLDFNINIENFIVLDYRTSNSVILNFSADVKTLDTLFLTFMSTMNKDSIISLFQIAKRESSNLSDEAIDNLVKVFTKMFNVEAPTGSAESITNMMLNKVNQYYSAPGLGNITSDVNSKIGLDYDFYQSLLKFYEQSGTYPAHLLFGGFTIELEIMGLVNFASFQVIGLRNTGLYDGIYFIEEVNHSLHKSKFTTKLRCKMLSPRVRKQKYIER